MRSGDSTELLERAGVEAARLVFQAHYRLLKSAVAMHGGHEVKWLGDGFVTAFGSAADAVRCAVAIQQTARRRAIGGRLAIRIGLHAGEAPREETDYFGTPVVIARRLCDHAKPGQILCSELVAGLLAGRHAFTFREHGAVELKGISIPVTASEVLHQHDEPSALLTHTPFVGRAAELAKLTQKLLEARARRGALVLLAGEPGIRWCWCSTISTGLTRERSPCCATWHASRHVTASS